MQRTCISAANILKFTGKGAYIVCQNGNIQGPSLCTLQCLVRRRNSCLSPIVLPLGKP